MLKKHQSIDRNGTSSTDVRRIPSINTNPFLNKKPQYFGEGANTNTLNHNEDDAYQSKNDYW